MYKATAFVLSVLILGCSINASASVDKGNQATGSDYAESGMLEEKSSTVSMDSIVPQNDTVLSENALSANEVFCIDSKEVYNDIIPDETENSLGQSISVNEEITDRSEWNESESVSQNDTVSENILQTEKELIPEAATEESEPQTISENETEIISEKKIISKVKIPTNTHVYLDPENLAGKGGIFSDSYEVINYGNIDVAIKIKNINIFYKDEPGIYKFSKDTVNDDNLIAKKINLDMIWSNTDDNKKKALHIVDGETDEYVIYLEASEYDENETLIKPSEASRGEFYFSGTLNAERGVQWNDGEISIHFDYEIINMESWNDKEEKVTENIWALEEN